MTVKKPVTALALQRAQDARWRIHRMLARASDYTLLQVEGVLISARDDPSPERLTNPTGAHDRLPCKHCGGARPPAEGAAPWTMRNGNPQGRQCVPCIWATRYEGVG